MASSINFYFKSLLAIAMVICVIGFGAGSVKAQNYSEFFRQKRTQEKYLLKQIAYLKLFMDQAWKGYKLVSGGLETINDFTSGEFKLHQAFISALSKVSSLIRNDFRVAEIIQFQLNINASFRALVKSSASTQAPNMEYFKQVQDGVIGECNADLDDLMDIVLSGNLEMNDAERLSRLDKIHRSMQEKYSFTRWFCREAVLLSQAHKQELFDYESLRRVYENK